MTYVLMILRSLLRCRVTPVPHVEGVPHTTQTIHFLDPVRELLPPLLPNILARLITLSVPLKVPLETCPIPLILVMDIQLRDLMEEDMVHHTGPHRQVRMGVLHQVRMDTLSILIILTCLHTGTTGMLPDPRDLQVLMEGRHIRTLMLVRAQGLKVPLSQPLHLLPLLLTRLIMLEAWPGGPEMPIGQVHKLKHLGPLRPQSPLQLLLLLQRQ
mmetsp:Transcript_26234/g.26478  ORF Transcript_26234/g.26478 Transcript_26234/m.26478 type:complete len:213 (+) Transcript_26234:215-853(+)